MKVVPALTIIATAFLVGWTRHRLRKWEQAVDLLQARIAAADVSRQYSGYDDAELPPIVRAYLDQSVQGSPSLLNSKKVKSMEFMQSGDYRWESSKDDSWVPFQAREVLWSEQPGLLWDASIVMASSFTNTWPYLQVCDAYMGEEMTRKYAILSVWDREAPEIPSGPGADYDRRLPVLADAIRWMAETLMVPGGHDSRMPKTPVIWKAIPGQDFQAVLKHADPRLPEAKLTVTFDGLTGWAIQADGMRPKWDLETEAYVMKHWIVKFGSYERSPEGFWLPRSLSAGWIFSTGDVDWYMHSKNSAFHLDIYATDDLIMEA